MTIRHDSERARGRAGPTPRTLAAEVGAVVADLPRFVGAPLVRRRHLVWGATPEEVGAPMPGDELVADAQYRTTRAVTVDAPPEAVWPWLVQVGCLRAGFYSDDLLDNLARPSARTVVPELQPLRTGQWVPMSPGIPSDRTAFRVRSFVEDEWMLWAKPDSTWSWRLTRLPGERTRLVTRVHARYDWSRPLDAVLGVLLMELGDFAMMRRMLLGIKDRAESLVATPPLSDEGALGPDDGRAGNVVWRSWSLGWLGVLGLALVNGGVHRAYEPALGVLPAEQLSNVTLLAMVVPWTVLVDRRHPTSSLREALGVGAMWGTLTVVFELLGGHYLTGADWRTLLEAYDLSAGHLWPLAVAGIVLVPSGVKRARGTGWRRREPRRSDPRPLLGLRNRPGRLALVVFRLPLRLYHVGCGRLLGHTFLVLTHVGRRTGLAHETAAMVLAYDPASGEAVVCSAWGSRTDWIRNLREHPAPRVQVGRATFVPEQRFLSAEEAAAVGNDFRRRHPLRVKVLERVLGVDLGSGTAVQRFVATRPFVAFRPASSEGR